MEKEKRWQDDNVRFFLLQTYENKLTVDFDQEIIVGYQMLAFPSWSIQPEMRKFDDRNGARKID